MDTGNCATQQEATRTGYNDLSLFSYFRLMVVGVSRDFTVYDLFLTFYIFKIIENAQTE